MHRTSQSQFAKDHFFKIETQALYLTVESYLSVVELPRKFFR